MSEKFTKNCPKCSRLQTYSCKSIWKKSLQENRLCNGCRGKQQRKHNGIFERICKCGKLLKYSCRQGLNLAKKHDSMCRNCATKESAKYIDRSFQKSIEYRKKMSESLICARKMSSKYHSEEYLEKLRIAKQNQILLLGTQRNYNPKACKFIEDFGKKNGYNFRHALNGGEKIVAGYSLDGYDEKKNVVFEYDEPKHNAISVKKNDEIRQIRIIQKIQPSMFIRYDEQSDTLRDVISGKEISLCLHQ